MLFNSIQFLIFFPIVVLLFYVVPRKGRYIWLLAASYYFYMCWNPYYAILIMLSTIITFLSGIGIEKAQKLQRENNYLPKLIVAMSLLSNLGILIFFKYFIWLIENLNRIFNCSIKLSFSIILPVGISFYTFQALSYTLDVYRGNIKAEKKFARYALFVSFFPQLVAGPIERSKNLLTQINNIHNNKFDPEKVRSGLCLMLWGFFLKLIIADRAAIFVDNVFNVYEEYGFVELSVAAVLFAFQILCDFNGYSIIAKGSSQVLGIELMDNFRQPYLATTINDFWRRWHISLTSWFTDYLYIPLGGNRKGNIRKMLNTMLVFLVSGLWHGASWHYVVWGGLHGIYQNISFMFHVIKNKHGSEKRTLTFSGKMIKVFGTFLITDIAWVFFRANSCGDAFGYFKQMLISVQNKSLLALGLEWYDWLILLIALLILTTVDILHENNIRIREWLFQERTWFRWMIYLSAIWVIILFGIYGVEYDASQFIYFQF